MIDRGADKASRGKAERSVLVRTVTTPPALPWDQARVAALEAVQSAPARRLAVRTRRLGRWRPGAPGSFAAVYVQADRVGDGFKVRQRVGQQTVTVRFAPERETSTRMRASLSAFLLAGGLALSVTAGVLAFNIRAEREKALVMAEQTAARRLTRAESAERRTAAADLIAGRSEAGAPLAVVLHDLAAMREARDAATPIEAVHWRPEATGVEVRSDDQPFTDRSAERSRRPLRAGVWLWAFPNTPPGEAP